MSDTKTEWATAPRMAAVTATGEYDNGLGDFTVDSPLFWWVDVQLTGNDGNAFSIIGQVARALKEAGLRAEAEAYTSDAMDSESYDGLLQHAMKTVQVH